jgi:hypothetical protein
MAPVTRSQQLRLPDWKRRGSLEVGQVPRKARSLSFLQQEWRSLARAPGQSTLSNWSRRHPGRGEAGAGSASSCNSPIRGGIDHKQRRAETSDMRTGVGLAILAARFEPNEPASYRSVGRTPGCTTQPFGTHRAPHLSKATQCFWSSRGKQQIIFMEGTKIRHGNFVGQTSPGAIGYLREIWALIRCRGR